MEAHHRCKTGIKHSWKRFKSGNFVFTKAYDHCRTENEHTDMIQVWYLWSNEHMQTASMCSVDCHTCSSIRNDVFRALSDDGHVPQTLCKQLGVAGQIISLCWPVSNLKNEKKKPRNTSKSWHESKISITALWWEGKATLYFVFPGNLHPSPRWPVLPFIGHELSLCPSCKTRVYMHHFRLVQFSFGPLQDVTSQWMCSWILQHTLIPHWLQDWYCCENHFR